MGISGFKKALVVAGLSKEQVRRLREEKSIYTIDSGRICVAALTSKNVDYVADAIAEVIR